MSLYISAKTRVKDPAVTLSLRQIELWAQPIAVTGSKGGNAALASLISALAQLGLIQDETT